MAIIIHSGFRHRELIFRHVILLPVLNSDNSRVRKIYFLSHNRTPHVKWSGMLLLNNSQSFLSFEFVLQAFLLFLLLPKLTFLYPFSRSYMTLYFTFCVVSRYVISKTNLPIHDLYIRKEVLFQVLEIRDNDAMWSSYRIKSNFKIFLK